MKTRWKVVALLFALINVGGGLYALRFGEWLHLTEALLDVRWSTQATGGLR